MKCSTIFLMLAVVAVVVILPLAVTQAEPTVTVEVKCVPCPPPAQRDVDIALCLDTSGSMDGLIESAKQKLWAIVNELSCARPKPRLRVALYHYGNDGLNREMGWVKQLCPLTDDLDRIYEELFKLRTNGGTELVARVIRAATKNLDWSKQRGALKMIVVAGNEPATQDKKYELHDICKAAINEGIIINTIFCGDINQGRRTGWANAAAWAEGQYAAIDQDRGTVVITTPYDKRIIELNIKLNATYVGYGRKGAAHKARQERQDANAASLNEGAYASRAASKASGLYVNSSWDVVDAVKDKKLDLENAPTEALPSAMQDMSAKERTKYVADLASRRSKLQNEISELHKKRLAYQQQEMKKQGKDDSSSFDAQLRRAIQTQGQKKGLVFNN